MFYKKDNSPIYTQNSERTQMCGKSEHIHKLTTQVGFLFSLNRMPHNWQSILWGTNASEPSNYW